MTPTKLELLAGWLPEQSWYRGAPVPGKPLAKAGGFRLDDPAGEVGIEFMVVADGAAAYLVPMTYRGAPLDGADGALIGTSEHGVLGTRWIYDGVYDPVLAAQLVALIQGEAVPQAQSRTDTPDLTVHNQPVAPGPLTVTGLTVADGAGLIVGTDSGPVAVRVHRVLRAAEGDGSVTASWRRGDGAEVRGVFVTAELSESWQSCISC